MRKSMLFLSLAGLWLAACNSSTAPQTPAVERGPKLLPIDGDLNGLWWDYATRTLYMADDNGNRILRWTDTGGIALVKNLPAPEGKGLGQVVKKSDGTLIVTRFGNGNAGDVVYLAPGADSAVVVPGLNVQRRRIGLTVADDGSMYVAWFTRANSTAPRVGSVGSITLTGAEPEVITGLKKPVGVLAVGPYLYVSDQDLGQILKAPRAKPDSFSVFAALATPDLLSRGPHGSLFSGNTTGNLYKIDSTGAASIFKTGFQQVHGIAYDSVNRRVFVADHDPDASNGLTNYLHILPVD